MLDRSRPRRSPSRYLAPLALVVTLGGTYLVIHNATGGATVTHTATTVTHRTAPRRKTGPGKSTTTAATASYVVRPGDNLSAIAARTGVSAATIESLNPGVSSNALQVGQRLRLRR
jgi:LysM repeat protein